MFKCLISRFRSNLAEKSEESCVFKRNILAVQNSLKKTNPPLQESDVENFIKYRQSFTNFIMRCEKWTTYRGDIGEKLRSKGQSFTLGLAKANCERNVLLSELNISDRSNRQLPTGPNIGVPSLRHCFQLLNEPSVVVSVEDESDVENFIKYRQSFTNFIMRCEKWTTYRGDIGEKLRSKGQSFTLGLAKANCERNVLLSELNISDRSNRQLPTEHLIYAARYEGTDRDITFANYQWRQLTYGFEVDGEHEASPVEETPTKDERPVEAPDVKDPKSTDDSEVLASVS
uniref:Tim44 domain-containing protein n=1 Tax=Ascaris lumbricoides TaxID=6252 RepID=A0A0M3IVE6_ASCLU